MSSYSEEENEVPNIGTYEGERNEHGARHGMGKCVHPNKDIYKGQYADGIRSGPGLYLWAYTGVRYKGEYLEGWRHGQGTMRYTNGIVYTGGWQKGRRWGKGEMTFPNGDVYTGEWERGLPHGVGTYTYGRHGLTLHGRWELGRIVEGELRYADGTRWVGGFRFNQPFGEGMFVGKTVQQRGEIVERRDAAAAEEEEEEEEEPEDEDSYSGSEKKPVKKFPDDVPRLPRLRTLNVQWIPLGPPEFLGDADEH